MLHCTASENVMKTSVMEFISENSWWLKPVNYYSKKLHHRDLHNIFWDIAKWCKIFWPQLFQQKYFMRVMERIGELVGNNAKGRISKRVLRENNAPNLPKNGYFLPRDTGGILLTPGYFLPPDTGSKECSFFGKFGVLCFPVTPIWDSPFCLIIDEFSRKISFQDFIKPLEVPQRSVKIKI